MIRFRLASVSPVLPSLLVPALLLSAAEGDAPSERKDYTYQPVPFTAVQVRDGFWFPRFETNRTVTVWYNFQKCEETGRIDNFAKAAGLKPGEFQGIPYDDSDVYKVIEGAAYMLAVRPDPRLDRYLDDLIASIAAAQEEDGYLYTARRLFPPEKMPAMSGATRWSNLRDSHELYNVGHLYEAAVAHTLATGKTNLLDVAVRNADLLCATFGPDRLQEPPGHEEIEIGLVKLYRLTSRPRYLDLARFFVNLRGRADTHTLRGPYQQDDKPIVDQSVAVGHAVRAGYFYSGVADVAAITGDQALVAAINRIWEDVTYRKLHLTGGIGARPGGEAFGEPYELPNRSAYLETCAAIANALWNHRMFLLHGDARYLDVLERVIYNGFLAGVSLGGDRFFYPNPLEADGHSKFNHGHHTRAPWFGTSCCPVNVVRFIPSIAGYLYATRGDDICVNLYAAGSAAVKTPTRTVRLTQATRYPWDGRITLTVEPSTSGEFALRLRIPGWARNRPVPGDLYRHAEPEDKEPTLRVNGRRTPLQLDQGFAVIRRRWQPGDQVELELPMPPRRVLSHPNVQANAGRVALERGPIVYCLEGADHPDGRILNLILPDDARLRVDHRADLLNGVTVIRARGSSRTRAADGSPTVKSANLTFIPYYAWNHRGPNEMSVWIPRVPERAALPPLPTLASRSRVRASFAHATDSLAAVNDQQEPRNSNDHEIPRMTWWDHRGTQEWIEYEFHQPARVSAVEVYWFDDTGHGSCRIPKAWRVLYRDGDTWKPVAAAAGGVPRKDAFDTLEFSPVNTTGLRLEVDLQPGFSGGILEWKVR